MQLVRKFPFCSTILDDAKSDSFHECKLWMQETLGNSVQVMEHKTEPRVVYQAADVFIMNSACENFARTVLEAMAMHLPVLGTNCGGTIEQVHTKT